MPSRFRVGMLWIHSIKPELNPTNAEGIQHQSLGHTRCKASKCTLGQVSQSNPNAESVAQIPACGTPTEYILFCENRSQGGATLSLTLGCGVKHLRRFLFPVHRNSGPMYKTNVRPARYFVGYPTAYQPRQNRKRFSRQGPKPQREDRSKVVTELQTPIALHTGEVSGPRKGLLVVLKFVWRVRGINFLAT
ncbi:MAG: hypothetical protein COA78_04600 [Blastopirellula sp.]|nr:MAG: hypothetical protein COA78_04600 [Blastopirellula sp.]